MRKNQNPGCPGACGGSIACSTCHLIIDPKHYDLLDEPGDDENDMLDLAYGLTDTCVRVLLGGSVIDALFWTARGWDAKCI